MLFQEVAVRESKKEMESFSSIEFGGGATKVSLKFF